MGGLLQGKVALITGAGAGIGRGAAEVFAREGAHLVLAGRTRATLEETAGLAAGAQVLCHVAAVEDAAGVQGLVDAALARFGRLDCALNNAGVDGALAPAGDYAEDEWRRVIDINLTGVWLCMRAQINAMLTTGGGAIVNVSSALGEVGQYSMPAYVASKHGVVGLSKAAALDYARRGIRVNALLPGLVETAMMRQQFERVPGLRETLLAMEPIGRFAQPREIAEAAAWLCSDRASYVTGTSVAADGGYCAR